LKSAEEILADIVDLIGQIYRRPLMYGGSATGVEAALWVCHTIWADALDRGPEFFEARRAITGALNAGAMNFETYFRHHNPGADKATEGEVASYVVARWKDVDAALGLNVPDLDTPAS
jgi:hypothetical protein